MVEVVNCIILSNKTDIWIVQSGLFHPGIDFALALKPWQLFNVKRSKVEERYNSAVGGLINFKLGGNYPRGVDVCGILSMSVGQTNRK